MYLRGLMCRFESFYLFKILVFGKCSPAVNWSSGIVFEFIELCICRIHIFSSVFEFSTELTSLKICVGRELRRGPNFGPVKYVKEVSHVKHMHTNSLLVHPNFSSKLMITWLKPTFGPLSNWSKTHFWFSSNYWRWTKIEFSNSLLITWSWIVRKLTFGPPSLVRTRTKIEFSCICFTWLTSFIYFTGPKFGPPRSPWPTVPLNLRYLNYSP